MPDNIQRVRGRPSNYKFDRGGMPAESGPYLGIVKNNIDPTRSGRLQVYIEQFAGPDPEDRTLWRTVSYIPPFYGVTPHTGTNQGAGTFKGNQQSYGMWFTPPDLGVTVICFFVAGDPNQGYYTGCVPDIGISHMIPAIGSTTEYDLQNSSQASYFADAPQLPVVEINSKNLEIAEDPRFFDEPKPVHSYLAMIMMQQGLIKDPIRGPITSNSQRETPSAAFGMITPGRAIYQGGLSEKDIKQKIDAGQVTPEQVQVEARRGGHSLVMDDGDIEGADNLVRIRTAKGHQITMSDDGDCFYIIHANGQTWLEFGKQGTVDVFSTNSVNVRTQGEINLHADKNININAGGDLQIKAKNIKQESTVDSSLIAGGRMTAYSKTLLGIKSDGALNLKSQSGSWDAGSSLSLVAGCINLNSGGGASVDTPSSLKDLSLPDTKFLPNVGWTVQGGTLKTIVTRAPTHEPWPYHNQGVNAQSSFNDAPAQPLSPVTQSTLDDLSDVPVIDGVQTADILIQDPAEIPVGSLNVQQTTATLAQIAKQVDQPSDVISLDKGIGRYGFSADQLEAAGYLKPGTVGAYLQDPADLESVLSSPSVWTGKSDIVNLGSLLADPKLQSVTQNEIMVGALAGLRQAGVVTGQELPAQLAPFVQVASKFGVNTTVEWVKGQAPAELVSSIQGLAKNTQYAVNLVDRNPTDFNFNLPGSSFIGTTDRDILDAAMEDVLGDPKVPTPEYGDALEDIQELTEITVTGGSSTITRRDAGPVLSAPSVEIRDLENAIENLLAVIRFRQGRGLDVAAEQAELLDYERRLAALRLGG